MKDTSMRDTSIKPTSTKTILPEWPIPENVSAFFTERGGGNSSAPYESLNLGTHVGDAPDMVERNRSSLNLPASPFWLSQIHSNHCIDADASEQALTPEADASTTRSQGTVLAVMVADCVPLLLADRQGSVVGVAHAGWRGLANGVIDSVLDAMRAEDLCAWIGPAIGDCHYIVGEDVRCEFQSDEGFKATGEGTFAMDLAGIAGRQLSLRGVEVFGGGYCTQCDDDRFFSYRRDGVTGRMAGFIWLE
ncbi:MAG: YfiH family protein [Candidatus Azotimanducaceae bacterium]